jgi:hypothetical protein
MEEEEAYGFDEEVKGLEARGDEAETFRTRSCGLLRLDAPLDNRRARLQQSTKAPVQRDEAGSHPSN